MSPFRILVLLALGLAALARVSAGAAVAAETEGTQISQVGPVTVSVARQEVETGLVFIVVMDTHAVNLDGYDLLQLAVLRTEQGDELQPESWDAKPGGHHREGTLTFRVAGTDGEPAMVPSGTSVELIIRDVGGVPERVFQWVL